MVADKFVVAPGPWIAELLPDVLGQAVQVSRQEVHFFGIPKDATEIAELPIWLEMGERIFYGIPGVEQRGFKIADDTRGEISDPTSMDRSPSRDSVNRAGQYIARRFPAMRDAPLVESRVCQYANSPDGHLIVDRHPRADNVFIVGGGSGHSFKLGPVIGERVADSVIDGAPSEPVFSLNRLTQGNLRRTQFDI